MKLIIGLGNPGQEYKGTRHNAGFVAIDALAGLLGAHLTHASKHRSDIAEVNYEGEKIILAKPQTFMNLSGASVHSLQQQFSLTNADTWVIYDDVALDLGTIRIRGGGSSGGHNGIKHIIKVCGDDFARIRIGVGAPPDRFPLEKWVLAKFTDEEASTAHLAAKEVAGYLLARINEPELEAASWRLNVIE
jgi:PTH1 family peptidyl-tRNA hydrolase